MRWKCWHLRLEQDCPRQPLSQTHLLGAPHFPWTHFGLQTAVTRSKIRNVPYTVNWSSYCHYFTFHCFFQVLKNVWLTNTYVAWWFNVPRTTKIHLSSLCSNRAAVYIFIIRTVNIHYYNVQSVKTHIQAAH